MRNAGLEEAQAGIKIVGRNINNLRYADDTTLMALEVIEAIALVRHHQNQPARLGQQRLALDQEPHQVRRVFDHVTGDDPVIPAASAERFGQRFALPHEVHVLDVVEIDARVAILCAQGRRIGVIQDVDAEAVGLACQRVETRPDLQARTLPGRMAGDETLAQRRASQQAPDDAAEALAQPQRMQSMVAGLRHGACAFEWGEGRHEPDQRLLCRAADRLADDAFSRTKRIRAGASWQSSKIMAKRSRSRKGACRATVWQRDCSVALSGSLTRSSSASRYKASVRGCGEPRTS